MAKKISIAFAAVLIIGLWVFIRQPESKVLGPPDIEGWIYLIEGRRILVAEGIEGESYGGMQDLRGNAIWLTVGKNAKITNSKGSALDFEFLNVGDRVRAWSEGPILESYPAQAAAFKVVLLDKIDEKDCFAGGCSGELCTEDSEMPSACEYLPGSECLKEKGVVCGFSEGDCSWILSEAAAKCFISVEEEYGDTVRETRIGYLFERSEELLAR